MRRFEWIKLAVQPQVTATSLLAEFAQCLGKKLINAVLQQDLVECMTEVFSLRNPQSQLFADPAFVNKLVNDTKGAHDRGIPTIFVAHSQGNLMLAKAFESPLLDPSFTPNPTGACTAALSLSTPIGPSFFDYGWLAWSGFTLNHDVINMLGMNHGVDSLPSPMSSAVDVFAQTHPIAWALKPVQVFWGIQVHFLANYLDDKRAETQTRLNTLIGACTSPLH